MPRPQRCRKVCSEPEYSMFYPAGFASGDTVTLTVDEYEVIRLVDLEKLTHSQAAELMEISRTTATEIYNIQTSAMNNGVVWAARPSLNANKGGIDGYIIQIGADKAKTTYLDAYVAGKWK